MNQNYKPSTVTKFFSEDGEIIGEFFAENREVVFIERLPYHLIQAFVAGEDAGFFHHKGLDYMAILRALCSGCIPDLGPLYVIDIEGEIT